MSWLTLIHSREDDQTEAFRGSKSRNKVSVGEPAEGSLKVKDFLHVGKLTTLNPRVTTGAHLGVCLCALQYILSDILVTQCFPAWLVDRFVNLAAGLWLSSVCVIQILPEL